MVHIGAIRSNTQKDPGKENKNDFTEKTAISVFSFCNKSGGGV